MLGHMMSVGLGALLTHHSSAVSDSLSWRAYHDEAEEWYGYFGAHDAIL